jgi:hypothetical protein
VSKYPNKNIDTGLILYGQLECARKSMARELKSTKELHNNPIYHLVVAPISILWKIRNQMESSIKELEEHHIWKVISWLLGYSLGFSSKFWMLDGSLGGIGGHNGACCMGSFFKHDKSRISKVSKKGSCLFYYEYW